jgi:ATP-binding cassette subfamily B protein
VQKTVDGGITSGELLAFLSITPPWSGRFVPWRILSEMSKAGLSIDRVNDILSAGEERQPAQPLRPPMTGNPLRTRHLWL